MADSEQIDFARTLRQRSTDAEALLWSKLRARQLEGAKFVRQFPIDRYIVDFCCRSARLIVEIDGGQHADSAGDARRTETLAAHGYLVIRFWNHDVLGNVAGVLEAIAEQLRIARGS